MAVAILEKFAGGGESPRRLVAPEEHPSASGLGSDRLVTRSVVGAGEDAALAGDGRECGGESRVRMEDQVAPGNFDPAFEIVRPAKPEARESALPLGEN